MNDLLLKFLSNYVVLTKEEQKIVLNKSVIKSFKKGHMLLTEGDVARECYFLLRGCVNSYYLKDGDIIITDFFTEDDTIAPISYTNKKPSQHYLECIEDCVVAIGTHERMDEILRSVPKLDALAHDFLTDQLLDQKTKYDNLIKMSPEERYLELLESSQDLLNCVPQYMIANYLGVQPETLSRIRKRIFK